MSRSKKSVPLEEARMDSFLEIGNIYLIRKQFMIIQSIRIYKY